MKVLLFGASGRIGREISAELRNRGEEVTPVTRGGEVGVAGDATDAGTVAELADGQDVIVSAIGPTRGADPTMLVDAARSLVDGARRAGVRRIVALGGAGSLHVAPDRQLVESSNFPAGWTDLSLAHRDALTVFRSVDDVDWTYVSPAAEVTAGERTGTFRVGGDDVLVDQEGRSRISVPDLAIGIADQVENPSAVRARITLAY